MVVLPDVLNLLTEISVKKKKKKTTGLQDQLTRDWSAPMSSITRHWPLCLLEGQPCLPVGPQV